MQREERNSDKIVIEMFVEKVIWFIPRYFSKRTTDEWSCPVYVEILKTYICTFQGRLCIEKFRAEFFGSVVQS